MNREKILLLVVLGLLVLFGLVPMLTGGYERRPVPSGSDLAVDIPVVEDFEKLPGAELLRKLVVDWADLISAVPPSGRTFLVAHSDLIPVEPAALDLPAAAETPVVLPPLARFPSVGYYRRFRAPAIPPVTGGPAENGSDFPDEGEELEGEEEEPLDEEEVFKSRQKWEFVPTAYDRLTRNAGDVYYGTISLLKEQKDQGHRKYDLLLPENRELPFYFQKISTSNGRVETTGMFTLEVSGIAKVEFADNIENRYWARRTTERVGDKGVPALLELARWTMEASDEPGYDRLKGLEFAVTTCKEALELDAGDLEAKMLLGEALHRAFRFDEELRLYEAALEEKAAAALWARTARVYRKMGLTDLEEEALAKALDLASGDSQTRLEHAEALFTLGRVEEAAADYLDVARGGTIEEQTKARAGQARVLLAQGKPVQAAAMLSGAEDADGLLILGAANYAQMKWVEAKEAFERALAVDPASPIAITALGFAEVLAAEDWQALDAGIERLKEARRASPLNYFWPPLGMGFAEQRRGAREEHAGRLTLSVDHYATAAAALPDNPYVHYILGVSKFRDGRYDDARAEFMRALELDFRFVDALIGAGTAAMEKGDLPTARNDLARALELERRDLAAASGNPGEEKRAKVGVMLILYRLARAYLLSDDLNEEKRLKDAQALFLEILKPEFDDRHVGAQLALGYISYQLGDVEESLRRLDLARDLAKDGTPERKRAEGAKEKILDSDNRRLWRDDFDRSGGKVANDWMALGVDGLAPRIEDGKALISGRMARRGNVWLYRGSKDLNAKFIAASAVMRVGDRNRVHARFFAYTYGGDRQSIANGVGIERSATGEVSLIHRRPNDDDWTRIPMLNEDGTAVMWPSGWVEVRVGRADHKKGVFEVRLNDERIGTVDLGIKRRAGTGLYLGFQCEANGGESFSVEVDEVEVEVYFK